jgi:hypothetical protein
MFLNSYFSLILFDRISFFLEKKQKPHNLKKHQILLETSIHSNSFIVILRQFTTIALVPSSVVQITALNTFPILWTWNKIFSC